METNAANRCPKCHEGLMQSWHELSDEEKDVVQRFPHFGYYSPAERESMHRWCTRCWHESISSEDQA